MTRRYTRVPIEAEARIEFKDSQDDETRSIGGVAQHLSIGGFFLKTGERVSPATPVRITLALAGPSGEIHVSALGRVSRHGEEGMGIEITKVALNELSRMIRAISDVQGGESRIADELMNNLLGGKDKGQE